MRAVKLRARSFIQTILPHVVNDADDLQREWRASVATIVQHTELSADWIFAGPVTLGHRVVDDRNLHRILVVKLIKQPASKQSHADRVEVSSGGGIDLRDRFLTRRPRRLAFYA